MVNKFRSGLTTDSLIGWSAGTRNITVMDSTLMCVYGFTVVIWNICCNKYNLWARGVNSQVYNLLSYQRPENVMHVVVSCLSFLSLLIDGMYFETNFKTGLCWGMFTFNSWKRDGRKMILLLLVRTYRSLVVTNRATQDTFSSIKVKCFYHFYIPFFFLF